MQIFSRAKLIAGSGKQNSNLSFDVEHHTNTTKPPNLSIFVYYSSNSNKYIIDIIQVFNTNTNNNDNNIICRSDVF